MQKKAFITVTVVVTVCCFSMFLSGCFSNKGAVIFSSPTPSTVPNSTTKTPDTTTLAQTTTPTPTMPPSSATQTPDSIRYSQDTSPTPATPSTPTTTLKAEEQTPDSTSSNQADPTDPVNTSEISTGLPDGTKVKLIVSGKELVDTHKAIIMGDEVLVPDYPYTFGQLKTADGEKAGFWTISINKQGENDHKEQITIYNSLYTIELVEGEYSFICNDETFPLTVPAQTIGEHIYVPVIALAEAINATVEWDADAQAINFLYK